MAARRTSGAKTLVSKRMPAMRMASAAILARKSCESGQTMSSIRRDPRRLIIPGPNCRGRFLRALPSVPGFLWPEFYIGPRYQKCTVHSDLCSDGIQKYYLYPYFTRVFGSGYFHHCGDCVLLLSHRYSSCATGQNQVSRSLRDRFVGSNSWKPFVEPRDHLFALGDPVCGDRLRERRSNDSARFHNPLQSPRSGEYVQLRNKLVE